MRLKAVALAIGVAHAGEEAAWEDKAGFIGATTADVESGHMTLVEAKRRCASSSRCEAITHRNAELKADPGGTAFFYLKAGKQVSESDRTWTSFVKKPVGLLDINFHNPFDFPLELCWVDITGAVAPVCYGSAAPRAARSLSSFDGHHFVAKRLVWSASASDAARVTGALPISSRLSAQQWETPPRQLPSRADSGEAPAVRVRNTLALPVEVCSGTQHHTRLLYTSVPVGLEACHGVAAPAEELELRGVPASGTLLARQLVGVTRVRKAVLNYTLEVQALEPAFVRTLVQA
jgi:hypothetical protein